MKNIIKIAEAYVLSRTAYKILLVLSTVLIAIPYIREKIGFIINIMMVYGFIMLIIKPIFSLMYGLAISTVDSTSNIL